MKLNRILFLFSFLLAAFAAEAQTATSVLDKAVSKLNGSGAVSASYSVTGHGSGTIVMKGRKFRILGKSYKTWYNGTTQWTYTTTTDEVNITTPSASDLQLTNPYAAAQAYKSNYNMTLEGRSGGYYVIKLTPKNRSNIKEMRLYVGDSSYLIKKAVCTMKNGSNYTITISNFKTNQNFSDATFNFDRNMVPRGTEVVDLR